MLPWHIRVHCRQLWYCWRRSRANRQHISTVAPVVMLPSMCKVNVTSYWSVDKIRVAVASWLLKVSKRLHLACGLHVLGDLYRTQDTTFTVYRNDKFPSQLRSLRHRRGVNVTALLQLWESWALQCFGLETKCKCNVTSSISVCSWFAEVLGTIPATELMWTPISLRFDALDNKLKVCSGGLVSYGICLLSVL